MKQHLNEEQVSKTSEKLGRLQKELNNVLFGQEELIDRVVIALLTGGHVLLEGLPGLGKTELVKGLGKAIELEVKRIQFTPDLLPGDITGTPILDDRGDGPEFVFRKGPIFTNLLLADEINRASPKTQSALLEAMQEKRVTVLGEGHQLPQPFMVLATQNPIELEGTYPLPEAQLDRFLFKLDVHRTDVNVLEKIISNREIGEELTVNSVLSATDLNECIETTKEVYLPDVVKNFIARLVDGTHRGNSVVAERIKFGASPRAAISLAAAARARALLAGRINASFEDVQGLAKPVLQHRIILDYQAKLEGHSSADVVEQLLEEVPAQQRAVPSTIAEERV